ncbi:beta strand repeat-containing protein [Turneriella parva]|nr:FG-GAP-like repeat-containing protein [Turneriella parva]
MRYFILAVAVIAMAGCRNFNWAPTDALEKVSTTPPNTVEAPVFAPAGGSYNATQNVTLTTSTPGATICYRNDGTNADCDNATATCFAGSTTYVGSINVPATITLNAMACKATMNNSVVATAVYTIDSTAPVISATAPAPGAYVTNTQVSYTLSESCGTGSITWTRTSGSPDPGSPRVQALVGAELTAGTHSAITLTNNPALVSGTVYDIAFNCTDAAGNAATTVTAAGVTFDNVAPVISGVAPITGSFRTNTQVSYALSEDCQTGTITWTRTGGAADGASPHAQTLVGLELTQGTKTNLTLANNPALVSGTIYTIDFNCQDFAGQNATTVTSTGVTFDNVAPIISGVAPLDSAFVSTTQVSYDLTEVCATASITWTRTGGSADPSSPHVQALTAGEMTAITHTNITITNNPTLIDGAVYQLDFNCTDSAGNVATTITRTNVTYDPSAVVISGVSPASSAFRNTTQVSYTLSENCASGNVTWTRTGGNPDPGSPRVQALTGTELNAGTKTNITLTNNPPLVDGAVYSVQFNCTDFAANASTPITVTNVTYDFTAPTITGTAPATGAFRNNNLVSFTYSENCASASITWTRTGGAADASSPHVQSVTGSDLNAGAHNGIIIANNPTLADGAVYTMAYACSDAAGNAATVISNTGITFDYTAPTVSISNLVNNSPLNTNKVLGSATDNLAGAITIEVQVDGGLFNAATGTPSWNFMLPTGAATWVNNTTHSIGARATDLAGNMSAVVTISVRKGNNHDVNGDGFPDLAIGGPNAPTTSTGKAYVFHGSSTGVIAATAIAANTVISGQAINDNFGRQLILADFNGDGFGDLAVSAIDNSASFGRVYVYNGSAAGLAAGASNFVAGTNAPSRVISGTSAEQLGSGLIAGNANNDGYADLIIGAVLNATQRGRFYAHFGGAGGVAAASSVTGQGEAVTAPRFSCSMALGDFNGDGNPDLAVGSEGHSTSAGRAYIYYGSAGTITGSLASFALSIYTGTASNFFGGSMAAGDLNGDGVTDLVVGGYGVTTNTGNIRVFYGVNGAGITLSGGAVPNATYTGEAANHYFATNMTIADTNADTFGDLIVGAHGSTVMSGRAYLFMGQAPNFPGGSATLATVRFLGDGGGFYQFGRAVAVTDINGDGRPDIFVGANFYNNPTYNGRVYGFFFPHAGPTFGATSRDNEITGSSAEEFGLSIGK